MRRALFPPEYLPVAQRILTDPTVQAHIRQIAGSMFMGHTKPRDAMIASLRAAGASEEMIKAAEERIGSDEYYVPDPPPPPPSTFTAPLPAAVASVRPVPVVPGQPARPAPVPLAAPPTTLPIPPGAGGAPRTFGGAPVQPGSIADQILRSQAAEGSAEPPPPAGAIVPHPDSIAGRMLAARAPTEEMIRARMTEAGESWEAASAFLASQFQGFAPTSPERLSGDVAGGAFSPFPKPAAEVPSDAPTTPRAGETWGDYWKRVRPGQPSPEVRGLTDSPEGSAMLAASVWDPVLGWMRHVPVTFPGPSTPEGFDHSPPGAPRPAESAPRPAEGGERATGPGEEHPAEGSERREGTEGG